MDIRADPGVHHFARAAVIAALVVTSCNAATPTSVSPSATAQPARPTINPGGVTIVVGDLGGERFDQVVSSGKAALNYARLMHGYLLEVNDKGELSPGIAIKWDVSADGLTWTFTVRKGVKFHDGSSLTADDVMWTFRHYFNDQTKDANSKALGRLITRLELNGADAVSISFKEPRLEFGVLVSSGSVTWLPIMPKRPDVRNDAAELAYDKNPIGAGPLRLVEHSPGQYMKFERFDDYYHQPQLGFADDQRVQFQKLELDIVPEEATRIAALRSGRADIAAVGLAASAQVKAAGGRMVFAPQGAIIEPRMYQCYKSVVPKFPCADKRVRQALDYSVNKKQLQDLFGGPEVLVLKGWWVVLPNVPGYTPELDPRPFDPDRARQLLAEAGYPRGAAFGKLILNTFPSPDVPLMVESAQLVADGWRKELGLDVEVRVGEPTVIRTKEGKGELAGQMSWIVQSPSFDASIAVASKYSTPSNIERYSDDPEITKLVSSAYATLDQSKRLSAIQTMYARLREESYNFGVGHLNTPWAVGTRIASWQPAPLALYPSALYRLVLR